MWHVYLIVVLTALCIGSFLNVVAYRLLKDEPLTGRSRCPLCTKQILWYDNIPLFSYLILRGKCRHCSGRISPLYPTIESMSGFWLSLLVFHVSRAALAGISPSYLIGYGFTYAWFIAALMVSVRTDLEAMVISQLFSIWLVPLGVLLSWFGFTIITPVASIIGAAVGYGVLFLVGFLFEKWKGVPGIGKGDMELLAMIGAFLGPVGVWMSVTIASIVGMLISIPYVIVSGGTLSKRIPFGPFLALGALTFFFFRTYLIGMLIS